MKIKLAEIPDQSAGMIDYKQPVPPKVQYRVCDLGIELLDNFHTRALGVSPPKPSITA
jgi:hypothetical protein